MLDPVPVSLEEQDLSAFFTGMILTMMADNFDDYALDFQRLTVGELDRKLVDVATKIFAAPQPSPFIVENESDRALQQEIIDQDFDMFCLRSGVKNPGAERRKREAAEQAGIDRRKTAQEKALTEVWGR
jgi:hypothetical protein